MNKWIVRIILLFTPLWRRLGVTPSHLGAILSVKLTIDDRRPGTLAQVRQKTKKQVSNRGYSTMLVSLVMGGAYLFLLGLEPDNVSGLTLYFFFFMLVLVMSLISDFTSVLIDVRDNYIILPRPVNARTVLVARLLHILVRLGIIVVPMALPGIIYFFVTSGPYGCLLFIADVTLATLICIFLVNAVYLVIMNFTTVERFKDIIGFIQVIFSVLIFALYQLGPHMTTMIYFTQSSVLSHKFMYAAPPLWLAALWQVLRYPHGQQPLLWCLGAAGLLLAPLGIWVVVRYLAPRFDRKISALGAGSDGRFSARERAVKEPAQVHHTSARVPLYRVISGWITKGNAEATGFEMAWLLTGRNRDFKLKVYPSFAYVIVYFFYFTMMHVQGKAAGLATVNALASTRSYILLAYLSSFALVAAITNLVYSEKYKAAWVYYVSPVTMPGEILTGAVKAMVVKFYVPFFILISIFATFIWGLHVLPDMLLGLVNVLWFGMLMGFIYLKRLPFSAAPGLKAGGGRFVKGLFLLVIPTITGIAHFLVRRYVPFLVVFWIFFALAAVLVWVIYTRYRELSWAELEVE